MAPGDMHTGLRARVRRLDADTLQQAVTKHRRFMVLMHDGADATTRAFQPWLFALANLLPQLPVGTIDLSDARGAKIAEAFQVPSSQLPTVKLLVRDNPAGQRIVDYRGPLEFDPLLEWIHAAMNDEAHELSAFGAEPPGSDDKSAASGGGAAGSAMSRLPESVRAMAATMIRETRLQRLLKQQGGGRVERYDQMVADRYRELIEEEGTDLDDKFAVQEANRRARDDVREELMKDAPVHVREEVEAEVSLGDAQNARSGSKDEL